jgi:predicted nucleic acid-binding protein
MGSPAAIALAPKFGNGVLTDDSQGRAAAEALKLKAIGSVGVLVIARERRVISALAPLLEALKSSGYYLSDQVTERALACVGEA